MTTLTLTVWDETVLGGVHERYAVHVSDVVDVLRWQGVRCDRAGVLRSLCRLEQAGVLVRSGGWWRRVS
jgi:hypothetical protein